MATGIWIIVWYLASKLSVMVRQRDYELAQANKKLAQAVKDRMNHMKVTTHELKSPFAAISSNANLLSNGYCGELPPKAVEVAEKISARCKRVIKSIQDILVLSNLHADSSQEKRFETVDAGELIDSCIEHIHSIAQNRNITIEKSCQKAQLYGNEDYLKTMVANLAANAVHYSNDNSTVKIECRSAPGSGPLIIVSDQGIGIPADKLPNIFDEHYRTSEARQHNRDSNGLGLAIVKNIAIAHKVQITVKSRPGEGTVFELQFPAPNKDNPGDA
jgi:two-component system phosphate regulon sensor histidine kinase PhoR